MKIRNAFYSLMLSLLVVSIASAAPDKGWKALLMKNSLKGWTYDVLDGTAPDDIYSIKKGILSIQGKGKSTAVIRTNKAYSGHSAHVEDHRFDYCWLCLS